jgi:UDPglucose--hexose-1-phosphate uridylyltransferase
MSEVFSRSHRRLNPLTDEWVLVSPHRLDRPWQGDVSEAAAATRPHYDPKCYLCPGNERAGGARNPEYTQTFVFENDYAALKPGVTPESISDGLIIARSESGLCRVVCFSPRHDLDIAQLAPPQIASIVDTWAQQYRELGQMSDIGSVTIFENRGALMGASNPHPHGQIWAQHTPPNELVAETRTQAAYAAANHACLLCTYVAQELQAQGRMVYANAHAVVIVPFWAVWPFETIVIPRRHCGDIDALAAEERLGLAEALRVLTSRYDTLFGVPFPYSMGFHQRPTDGATHESWHAHAHYYPPLLRSAAVRKFMVGYELLAEPQRDITPENAAERLRAAAPKTP